MLDIPQIDLTPEWSIAWTGFELYLRAQNRSKRTILSRKSYTSMLARWCISEGATDPGAGHQGADEAVHGRVLRRPRPGE